VNQLKLHFYQREQDNSRRKSLPQAVCLSALWRNRKGGYSLVD